MKLEVEVLLRDVIDQYHCALLLLNLHLNSLHLNVVFHFLQVLRKWVTKSRHNTQLRFI